MNDKILEDIGLSRSEIKVYLALLELGETTSGPIIQKSGIQSSVVHRVLKTLLAKGIVTYVQVGKNKEYRATNPDNIVNFIDNKKKEFLDILPLLKAKQEQNKQKNAAQMYLGKRAMFSALQSVIKDGKAREDYFSFSLIEPHDDKQIVSFYKNYNLRRREKKLNVRVLVNKSVKPIYEKNYTKQLLKKAKVRYTDFDFPQGIIIFRDTVTFVHWGENPFAVKITSEIMALQFKQFFRSFYEKEKDAY